MLRKITLVSSLLLLSLSASSQAAPFDIDLLTGPNPYGGRDYSRYLGYAGPTYDIGGYLLSSDYYDETAFLNWIDLAKDRPVQWQWQYVKQNANNYNPTVALTRSDATLKIRKDDNSSFSFNGIHLADFSNTDNGGLIDITFKNKFGSTYTNSVELSKAKGLQHFSFAPNNVTEVYIQAKTTQGHRFQFDFLDFGEPITSSVPEPSTWALMLIGFGVVGYSMRRTRQRPMRMQAV